MTVPILRRAPWACAGLPTRCTHSGEAPTTFVIISPSQSLSHDLIECTEVHQGALRG